MNIKINISDRVLFMICFILCFWLVINKIISKDVYYPGMDDYNNTTTVQPGIPTYMNKTP